MISYLYRHFRAVAVVSCIAFIALTGCQRLPDAGPAVAPPPSATPRSTSLPPIPTDIPAGAEDNPIRLVFTEQDTGRTQAAIREAASELEAQLAQASGLTLEVALVETDAEALAELCASKTDQVTLAWFTGVGYAAAFAQNCGTAAMRVVRGSLDETTTGVEVALYANVESEVGSVAALAGKVFCRLNVTDLYTWLVPSVMMRAASVSLISELAEVRDYDDISSMLEALAAGDCDAIALNPDDYEQQATASIRRDTTMIAQSVEIPYAVMAVPTLLPLGQKDALIDALLTTGNGANSDMLRPLLLQNQLERVDDADFARLRSFFNQAGLNLAELGT